MPLRHAPPSLQRAAMMCIADNFERICYHTSDPRRVYAMFEDESYLDYPSPFLCLPWDLLSELSECLQSRRGQIRRHHMHMVLLDNAICWRLGIETSEPHRLVELLAKGRAKNLQSLNLSYLRDVTPPELNRLIPQLTQIRSLNLQMTLCTDGILELVGRHCHQLTELNVQSALVSDAGLRSLCEGEEGPRCVRLQRLLVTETQVTPEGVAFALRRLPELREIDFDDIMQAFDLMSEDTCLAIDQPRLKLVNVKSYTDYVSVQSVETMVTTCPELRLVSLNNAWLENETLWKLGGLPQLCELYVTNSEALTLDFQEGVVPLLQMCGQRLKALILSRFTNVDLTVIGRLCPGLHNLAFSSVASFDPVSGQQDEAMFSKLEVLELWSCASLSAGHFRLLLAHCVSLKNLLLHQCDTISDQLLNEVWQTNPMRRLSRLTLDTCPRVSPLVVHQLMDMDNQLTVLRMWSCEQLNKQLGEQLTVRAKQENMDLYVEWFSYDLDELGHVI